VQAAINAARGQLPTNLPSNPTYRKINPADAPIMMLALTSMTYPKRECTTPLRRSWQQKLAQTRGVGQVLVGGGAAPAVRVEVNPTVLNHYRPGISKTCARRWACQRQTPKGSDLPMPTRLEQLSTTDQLLQGREYQPLLVILQERGAGAVG
jgi:multidrug efflux pump subunit AcrB